MEDDEFESVPRTFMYSPLDIDEDGLTEEEIKEERRTSRVKATMESEICGYEELWLKDLGAGFTCQLDKLPQIIPMEFQFVKLTFKSYAAMKACSFALQSEDVKRELSTKRLEISIYEANLDPHIRLMHLTKCEPSGWISLPGNKFKFVTGGDRRSSSQIEIEVPNWKDIHPLDLNTLAPFRECSFDLETYSNDDGKMSSAYVHENVVLQIATTFTDFGSKTGDIRVLYNLHDCDPIDEPNTVLKTFDNEKDMLLAWAQLISNSCPDTVHAYNGWEFDFEYLIQRAKIRGCWDQFRRTLGRIKSIPSQRVEQSLSSKAYGDNFWVMLTMSGRIVFDPLVHLQREFKLKSYALKDTSEYFLATKLPKQPFRATAESDIVHVTHPNHGLAANKVVHFSDVDLPEEETTPDGKRFYSWNGWTYEDLNTTLFTITSVVSKDEYTVRLPQPAKRSCQGGGGTVKAFETKHDVSFPVMNQAYRDNNSAVMHDVMRYCCQDTLLPQKILTKLCVLPNLIEMSKVTWVPLDYLITRGQQVKVFSQICKAAHEAGYAVPTIVRPKSSEGGATTEDGVDEGYVGGAVLEPFIGFYDDPIAVPDFKSLYPSTMIDNNLCPTTLLKDKKYDNIPGVMYNRIQVGSKTHVFGMNNDGIVPGILAYLLNTRDRRKEMMANAKTDIERMIHNGAQLALKVSANSIYGFMGIPADKAMLPCMPIAESTTQRGRNGTFATRDFMQDTSNFTEIMKYDANKDGMPLDWLYLMKNVAKNKCFHLTGEKLLKAFNFTMKDLDDGLLHAVHGDDGVNLQVWTSNEFDRITGFSLTTAKGLDPGNTNPLSDKSVKLLRVHTLNGIFFDMQQYHCKIVYGDSVTADTPVLIRTHNNVVAYVNIEDVPRKTEWGPYLDTKQVAQPIDGLEIWSDKGFTPLRRIIRHKTDKDIYRVLTHTGSVNVTSDHSLLDETGKEVRPVDVKVGNTLLHSELPQPETYLTPGSMTDGCPYSMGLFYGDGSCGEDPEVTGYGEKEKTKYSWAINNLNKDFLNRAKDELEAYYPALKFNILDTVKSTGVYKLVPNGQNEYKKGEPKKYGVRDLVNQWRPLFYTSRKQKIVPVDVLNAPMEKLELFMDGYYAADGDKDIRGYYRFDNKGSVGAAGLLYLAFRMGYSTSINTRKDKPEIYRVTCTKKPQRKSQTAIKKIEKFGPTTEFVYDLETDNHHFAAGVGKLVVHNTDSVFSKFKVDHLPKSQPHRVAYCSVVAAYVASRVTHFLRSNNPFKPFDKQWMELQYEKTYRFWLLFSKKRYAGEMTEHDPFHFADDQKGVASKRRDFCNYVKEIYGKILKSLFDPSPDVDRDTRIKNAISVVRKAIEDLLNNRVPFEKLVISKLLKSQYKVLKHSQSKSSKLCDFNHDNVFVDDLIKIRYGGAIVEAVITKIRAVHAFSGGDGSKAGKHGKPLSVTIKTGEFTGKSLEITFGDITERSASVITLDKIMDPKTTDKVLEPVKHPHVRLARRMFLRDPATAPKSGARVPYVFCESKTKVLQYLRAEDPSYAKAHKLVVDPEYYLKKQCENAWAQILDTACPGISATIFAEAYAEYEKKSLRQPDIVSYMAGTHTQKKSIELSKTVAKAEAVVAKSGPAPAKSIASYFTPVKAVKAAPIKAAPIKAAPIKAAPIKAAPVKVKESVKDKVKEEQVPAKVKATAAVKDELPKGSRSSQLIQAPIQAGKYVIKL